MSKAMKQEPVAFSWVNDDGFLRKKPTEQTAKQEPVAWIWEGRDGYATIELIDLDEQDMENVSVKSMTPLYTFPPAQRKPLTDEMVVAAARMLSDRQAAACNVDCGDMWKLHGNDFIDDARAALEAAHGIGEKK